jgi:hypothetical protein
MADNGGGEMDAGSIDNVADLEVIGSGHERPPGPISRKKIQRSAPAASDLALYSSGVERSLS